MTKKKGSAASGVDVGVDRALLRLGEVVCRMRLSTGTSLASSVPLGEALSGGDSRPNVPQLRRIRGVFGCATEGKNRSTEVEE